MHSGHKPTHMLEELDGEQQAVWVLQYKVNAVQLSFSNMLKK